MSKKALVTITLTYDTEGLSFSQGKYIPDNEFEEEEVKDAVLADLRNYMLSDPVEYWAEIVVEND